MPAIAVGKRSGAVQPEIPGRARVPSPTTVTSGTRCASVS
jgi:hypothetical protein